MKREFAALEVGIHVGTDDLVLAAADVLKLGSADGGNRLLDGAGSEGGDYPSLGFDFLENPPTFRSDLVGEPLDVSRTTGWVDDPVESAFLAQDRVEVAGDAAREGVGLAGDLVVGADVEAIHSGDNGGKRLGGDAQHVGVGVVGCLVPARGAGVQVDWGVSDAVCGGDFAPEPAGGAQLGDFHEIIRPDSEAEADVRKHGGRRETSALHLFEIGHQGGDDIAEFLGGGGTSVVIDRAFHRDGVKLRRILRSVIGERGELVEAQCEWLAQRAFRDPLGERIVIKATAKLAGGNTELLGGSENERSDRNAVRTGLPVGGNGIHRHPGEGDFDILDCIDRGTAAAIAEATTDNHIEFTLAATEALVSDLVEFARIGGAEFLGDFPTGFEKPFRMAAADE